jgi:uncharacterized protein
LKKLLLMSDTHFSGGLEFPDIVWDQIDDCDQIIHAGDFTSLDTYEELQAHRPVIGALGNTDSNALSGLIPEINELEVYGVRIGVVHGWGSPKGIVERIYPKMAARKFDIVVFGHSHIADICGMGSILFVNPGSVTSSRFSQHNSVATLAVSEDGFEAPEIITF